MSLTLILGPMFSGKTTYLLHKLKTYEVANKSVMYMNHRRDTRGDLFSTHNSLLNPGCNIECTNNLSVAMNTDADVIGFDEAQFYDDAFVKTIVPFLLSKDKIIVICGLDGDCKQRRFGYLLDLIPICDKVKKLHAVCNRCNGRGIFSKRLDETDVGQISIGGADKYISVCRACNH